MKHRKVGSSYIVSVERGEEIVASLRAVCEVENITLASVSGIGAAQQIEMGYYNVRQREYSTKLFEAEHEITALIGNVSSMNGEVYLHLHITIGDKAFNAYAGHLVKATVSGACEIIMHTVEGTLERYKDEEVTGLNLLRF
ncbi:MAG: PPC domain-containing DNA-binding protein [Candidatus Andersenbacteria bacterium]